MFEGCEESSAATERGRLREGGLQSLFMVITMITITITIMTRRLDMRMAMTTTKPIAIITTKPTARAATFAASARVRASKAFYTQKPPIVGLGRFISTRPSNVYMLLLRILSCFKRIHKISKDVARFQMLSL